MNDDTKNKLKDVLSTIDPVEFKWDETNTTVGVIAQDVSAITLTGDLCDIGMDSIDLTNIGLSNGITITGSLGMAGKTYTIGSSLPGNITYNTNSTLSAGDTVYGKTTIKTAKNEIDIDELANMMEVLKKRLLIIAPNFEMHEKYPMLKEMYNEYKAMEKLLGGPDSLDEK
jgi:hypothetical protein